MSLQVIGGELQDRLIPVPYSKAATDEAVSWIAQFRIARFRILSFYALLSLPELTATRAMTFFLLQVISCIFQSVHAVVMVLLSDLKK